ncbi:MAG: hypothetical protein WB526_08115, partial [Candidatus Cybelea sp.]
MKEIFRKLRVLAWIVQTSADENDRQTATTELVPICAPTGYALFKNLGEAPTVSIIPANGPFWAVFPVQEDGDVHPVPVGYSEVAPYEPYEPDWHEEARKFLAEAADD